MTWSHPEPAKSPMRMVKWASDIGRGRIDRFFMESSMLRGTILSELKSALEQLEGESKPGRSGPERMDYAARRSETTGRCRRPPRKGTLLPLELSGLVEIELPGYAGSKPERQARRER